MKAQAIKKYSDKINTTKSIINITSTQSPYSFSQATKNIKKPSIKNSVKLIEQKHSHMLACQDNLQFMNSLAKESIDLIVTSPPYNIGKSYEAKKSLDAYIEDQKKVIKKCVELLAPNGSICWQVGNHIDNGEIYPLDIILYPIFKEAGLKLRNRIVWQFGHGLHCTKRLSGRHETILWFTKENSYTFDVDLIRVPTKYPGKKYYKGPKKGQLSSNPLGKNPGDVWNIPNVKSNHVEKTIHPCQFPVELVERLILSMTQKGQKVFDPYMGVGSSIIAAVKNDRVGMGCDISKEYFQIAVERVEALEKGLLKTREIHTPIYDPSLPNGGQ